MGGLSGRGDMPGSIQYFDLNLQRSKACPKTSRTHRPSHLKRNLRMLRLTCGVAGPVNLFAAQFVEPEDQRSRPMSSKDYFERVADQWDAMRRQFFSEEVREQAVQAAGAVAGSWRQTWEQVPAL